MARSKTEQDYYDALQRLIDKRETVSLNAVAVEAGKKSGTLRAARFPNLTLEINRIIELQQSQAIKHKEPKFTEKLQAKDNKLHKIERDYEIALQRVVSLELQVFKLQEELAMLRENKDNVRRLSRT